MARSAVASVRSIGEFTSLSPRRPRLHALQIDPKLTFERFLPRIASESVVERIRGNRLYAGLVDSLLGVLRE